MTISKMPIAPGRARIGANYPCYEKWEGMWFGPLKNDVPECRNTIDRWHREGRDTTNEPYGRRKSKCWRLSFPKMLEEYRRHHISVLRLFLLGNACNYGNGFGNGWEEPKGPNRSKWLASYPDHLRELLDLCQEQGVRVKLVFISFGAFDEHQRPQLAKNAEVRRRLFENVLGPMVEVSAEAKYKDTVESWEPVNEPNWATKYWVTNMLMTAGAAPVTPCLEPAQMDEFLEDATQRILRKMPNVAITHGFAYGPACTLGNPKLALLPSWTPMPRFNRSVSDEILFPKGIAAAGGQYEGQFHYYPGAAAAPVIKTRLEFRNDLPAYKSTKTSFLGEISTGKPDWATFTAPKTTPGSGDPQFLSWLRLAGKDESGDYAATFYRLVLCDKLKYKFVCLWPNQDHTATDDSAFSSGALLAAKDYATAQTLPMV